MPHRVAERLGEGLRSFELRGGLARPETGDARGAQRVRQPGDQRRFRTDHDEIDPLTPAEGRRRPRDRRGSSAARLGDVRDAGIAGRDEQLCQPRAVPSPGQRMLAAARADQQDVHRVGVSAGAAIMAAPLRTSCARSNGAARATGVLSREIRPQQGLGGRSCARNWSKNPGPHAEERAQARVSKHDLQKRPCGPSFETALRASSG